MQVIGLNALSDNYIWILHENDQAWVVDPGESKPVLHFLAQHKLKLQAILITHHHFDHTAGIEDLLKHEPTLDIFAGHLCPKPYVNQLVKQDDEIQLGTVKLRVIETPGHTLDHVSYVSDQFLFCGDTLFTAGCGRIFEGTAEQMTESLLKLRALDDGLQVFCGHEYTLTNLNFAKTAEPNNPQIEARYKIEREKHLNHQACVPSSLGEEKRTNPFLRFDQEPLSVNISHRLNKDKSSLTKTNLFAELRAWKDILDQTGELENFKS